MSAGAFEISRYQAGYGAGTAIHPIRVQPETLAAEIDGVANDAPTAAANSPISAHISKSKNEYGLRPRFVTLRAPATSPPAGYQPRGITRIPALTPAFYNVATRGKDCSYLGVTFTVVSQTVEDVK